MRKALLTIVVLSLAGCSNDDGGKSEPCDPAHRSGTYVQHMTERANGNCGAIADQVVRLDQAPSAAAGDCSLDAPDSLSADQCTLSRSYTCVNDQGTSSWVAVTTEHDGGGKLTGVTTVNAESANGVRCSSTYDVTITRQ